MRLTALACLGALLLAVPALAQDAGEITYWESVKDSKSPAELQTYLDAYPQGKFAALARIRITALGGAPHTGAIPQLPAAAAPAPNQPATATAPPAMQPAPVAQAPAPAEATWREFRPAGGGFTVLLPGEPKVTVNPADENGHSEHRFLVDLGDTAYIVAYDDYAPGHLAMADPNVVLDSAQAALLKGLNGTLRNRRPVTLDGHAGREILFDTPDHNTGKVRVYLVGDRLYQAWYMGPTGLETKPDADRFLTSFQLAPR